MEPLNILHSLLLRARQPPDRGRARPYRPLALCKARPSPASQSTRRTCPRVLPQACRNVRASVESASGEHRLRCRPFGNDGGDKPVNARLGRYLAVLGVAAVVVVGGDSGSSRADDSSLAYAALAAAGRGDWARGAQLAGVRHPIRCCRKLVLWLDATRTNGGGSLHRDHRLRHRQSGLAVSRRCLRQQAEQALDPGTSDQAVLAWFDRNEPLTLPGANRYRRRADHVGRGCPGRRRWRAPPGRAPMRRRSRRKRTSTSRFATC